MNVIFITIKYMTSYLILRDWIDIDKLNYNLLCLNKNAIDWNRLSKNTSAIKLLTANKNKINWEHLSSNKNAIKLLNENQDKIDWVQLSSNENAMELLKEHYLDGYYNIDWDKLSSNPSIFTYDYKKIKDDFKDLGEEILVKALHPDRLFKLMNNYDKNEVYNSIPLGLDDNYIKTK